MKKMILILCLLLAVGVSAQSIVDDAKATVKHNDRKALVSYAAGLVKEKAKLERRIAEILKRLQAIDAGDFKAHQIPSGCPNCVTLNNNALTWTFDSPAGGLILTN
ncbi:hypothetical protein LCGC14_1579390 [marine sediment metagenome]|uniref:Uncharacterized protein n=1 Tax=marine sediment metagenome TaxID=412755 RepID=A0A0F9IHB5_9ZZZZ